MVSTPLLVYLSSFSILLPATLALIQWKVLNKLEKGLGIAIFGIAIVQMVALLISDVFKENNMPLYHAYLVLEFLLLSRIYYFYIFNKKARSTPYIAIAVGLVALLVNCFFVQDFMSFPSYLRSVQGILLIMLALGYFFQLLKADENKQLSRDPAFIMSCAILLYYFTNLLLFWYSQVLQSSPEVFDHIWTVHGYLNMLLYILYSVALVCRKKR